MGDRDVMFMGNHGILVVGRSLANAWDDLYYLERACENQVLAMSTGLPLREIPAQLVQATKNQILHDATYGEAHLAAICDVLDREEPEYRL